MLMLLLLQKLLLLLIVMLHDPLRFPGLAVHDGKHGDVGTAVRVVPLVALLARWRQNVLPTKQKTYLHVSNNNFRNLTKAFTVILAKPL
jgi:hypothetical protein